MFRRLMFAAALPIALAACSDGGGGAAGSGLVCVKEPVPEKTPAAAGITDEKNAAFLADYDAKSGVTKTASGLRYRVVQAGSGSRSPKVSDTVVAHYRGSFIDGTMFDASNCAEPAEFPLNALIKGWQEGIPLMKEGDVYEFAIPYDLAYGANGRGPIPPRQTLLFQVELIKIK